MRVEPAISTAQITSMQMRMVSSKILNMFIFSARESRMNFGWPPIENEVRGEILKNTQERGLFCRYENEDVSYQYLQVTRFVICNSPIKMVPRYCTLSNWRTGMERIWLIFKCYRNTT